MTIIYHYDGETGCALFQGSADANPLDPDTPLLPAYSTPRPPIATGDFECARYLTPSGDVPAHHSDGAWVVQPDWRDARLWSTDDGRETAITEPNVTPDDIGATVVPYPGPGYVWRDDQWHADPDLQYQLAEQEAERELASRQAVATAEINRIKPAVDGGYAKPEDVELLPALQRYLYELPDVRTMPGWPDKPQWPDQPATVI
ncbi:tail fiber assembly protein [Aeromonas veronii]|uniref:tail fiber assembly protein n=1 Tax=Aeromonas veronii TaxID=654 RepID=UPI002B4847C6|nr:tail fiber assembly protein [Aeromonas veronii]